MGEQASYRQEKRYSLAERILGNSREILAIILFGLTAYLLIALWSFNPVDPGWSNAADATRIFNKAGLAGAWLADFILYWFGYLGNLIPFILLFDGILLLLNRGGRAHSLAIRALRFFGGVTVFISACGLAAFHFNGSGLPLAVQGGGGVLGNLVVAWGEPIFGLVAGTLLLSFMLVIGITLYAGVSWLIFAEFLGYWFVRGADRVLFLWNKAQSVQEIRAEKKEREVQVREKRKEFSSRPMPHINPKKEFVEPGTRSQLERQEKLFAMPAETTLPALELLDSPPQQQDEQSPDALRIMSQQVELKLADFGIEARVVEVYPGPVIIRFELELAPGIKVSRVVSLNKDLARSLSVASVRVVDVIPGKSVIGLEIPKENREIVSLSEILKSSEYEKIKSPIPLALGKDVRGNPVIADLAKMPHLLVAGTTGSGKSVALNAMILSILYRSTAQQVRLLMIDPKMLELSVYDGIPHLLVPVITDMKQSANALNWCITEMDRRYKLMSQMGVRNIAGFNQAVSSGKRRNMATDIKEESVKAQTDDNDDGLTFDFSLMLSEAETSTDEVGEVRAEQETEEELILLPHIVVVVDELADMMMVVGKKVEELITRLAQKARAAGIHLVFATQRPSVDVITGLIKANVPSRIAFQVSSKIDSRTILDQMGAESLLGHGDMLFLASGSGVPTRVHGAFVDDHEVHHVVEHIKAQATAQYDQKALSSINVAEGGDADDSLLSDNNDPLYEEALRVIGESRRASISYLQRRLRIGYNRAARLIEEMEASGIIGQAEPGGNRQILTPAIKETERI